MTHDTAQESHATAEGSAVTWRPKVPSSGLSERDLAYRRALGVSESEPLPAAIGAQSSARVQVGTAAVRIRGAMADSAEP